MDNKTYITCPNCNTSFDKSLTDKNQNSITCIYCDAQIYNIEKESDNFNILNETNSFKINKSSNFFHSKVSILGNTLLVTAILGCFSIAGIYQYREILSENQTFRPLVKKLCKTINCSFTEKNDASKIVINNPKVLSDHENKLAMILTANLENRGNSAQRYPNLQINFLNNKGETLYRQVYKPNQYLKNYDENSVIFQNEIANIEIKFLAQQNSDATDLSLIVLEETFKRKT